MTDTQDSIEITIPKVPIKRGDRHPAAQIALDFMKTLTPEEAYKYLTVFREENDAFTSCTYAMEQLLNGNIVSDTYLLGLVLTIKELQRIEEAGE